MEILIKNMVCRHCVTALQGIADSLGAVDAEAMLGKLVIPDQAAGDFPWERFDILLRDNGFERILDRNTLVVEKIKDIIIRHVRIERHCPLNLSACLERHLGNISYDTASRIFSASEGRTVEKYFIAQKVELVKELLGYNQMTLNEIADMTGYSSVSHLSRQFKEITGMSPTQYLRSQPSDRIPLNEI